MDDRSYGCSRRALLGTLLVFLLLFGCLGITTLTLDLVCYNTLVQKAPVYPQAEVSLQRYNMLRPFGLGETIMVLETDDSVETVRDWYGRTVAAGALAARENRDPFFYLARGAWSVTTAEDGTGTQIVLSGVCGG